MSEKIELIKARYKSAGVVLSDDFKSMIAVIDAARKVMYGSPSDNILKLNQELHQAIRNLDADIQAGDGK